MKMQIKRFSDLTGVSVRTLHYYDEIGLLKPAEIDEHSGYRFYDDASFVRMQEILFFRELDFSLKSIYQILSGLGQMYVTDERFKENIDKHAKGTADFLSRAIMKYCN